MVERLLSCLDKYLIVNNLKVKIIILENLSGSWIPKSDKFCIHFVSNLRQNGFGQNHNKAFEIFKSNYFLVLNPDIIFFENLNLEQFILNMNLKKLKLASPLVLNSNFTVADNIRSDITLKNLLLRHLRIYKSEKLEWIAGMFLVIESSAFISVRGFDPMFYMYVEDCDLSFRLKKSNLNIGILHKYRVIHEAQRGSRKNLRLFFWHISSILKYLLFRR
jgi:GT2 family glycosyltransferase